ncbi:hypothetical protein Mapa_011257 [Marchantia paleacea]|nr:hypothetical protein Mapa_011257 [Marchantia paleacea]
MIRNDNLHRQAAVVNSTCVSVFAAVCLSPSRQDITSTSLDFSSKDAMMIPVCLSRPMLRRGAYIHHALNVKNFDFDHGYMDLDDHFITFDRICTPTIRLMVATC